MGTQLEEARIIMKRKATTSHAMSFTQLTRNKEWKELLDKRGFIEVTTHDGLAGYFISPELAEAYAQQSEAAEIAEDERLAQTILDMFGPLDSMEWANGEDGAQQTLALLASQGVTVEQKEQDTAR